MRVPLNRINTVFAPTAALSRPCTVSFTCGSSLLKRRFEERTADYRGLTEARNCAISLKERRSECVVLATSFYGAPLRPTPVCPPRHSPQVVKSF
jgi:hypothetical protein